MKTLLFVLSALSLVSTEKCGKNTADTSNLVELQTGACFGFCPVFTLTVLNNGLVRYEGKQFVEKPGKDSVNLTAEELKRLKAKVKEVNLWQYPDMIKTDVVDAPFATLTAWEADKSKSVRGSIDRPAPLLELEALLKDLAEAHGLNVKRGVSPHDVPKANRSEILLKLKPDVNAGNWIQQFDEIKLQLVRRVSTDNIWLVAYDTKQVDEKTLIELLKGMDGVVEVQANKEVKERN
jgi:hypothetical protein